MRYDATEISLLAATTTAAAIRAVGVAPDSVSVVAGADLHVTPTKPLANETRVAADTWRENARICNASRRDPHVDPVVRWLIQ